MRRNVAQCGEMWRNMGQRYTIWHKVAQCGAFAMCHNVAQCGVMWHNVEQCSTMWHNVAQCGAM